VPNKVLNFAIIVLIHDLCIMNINGLFWIDAFDSKDQVSLVLKMESLKREELCMQILGEGYCSRTPKNVETDG